MKHTQIEDIVRVLSQDDNFLILSHANPDGDALGSTVALGALLRRLGKKFTLYNPSGIPDRLNWITTPARLEVNLPSKKPSWIIALDCGDADRAGAEAARLMAEVPTINIDHHLGNPLFGKLNWVDSEASSVGEMIGRIAGHLKQPLNGLTGEGVYLAIVTDTGFFSYGNTSPATMEMAAEIIRQGLIPAKISMRLQNQSSLSRIRLQGEVLSKSQVFMGGKVIMISVTQDMLSRTGATIDDCEGLVNLIRTVKGVQVAVSLREDEPKKIKFSLRSWEDTDVQKVARCFGGGGHKNASGGAIHSGMPSAREQMLSTIKQQLGFKN